MFAFLPFQVSPRRYVVAVYVSTYDATRPMPEERYRLLIRGFADLPGVASLYDPISDHSTRLDLEAGEGGSAQVVVSVADYPRLLILDQGGEQKSQRQMRDRFVAGARVIQANHRVEKAGQMHYDNRVVWSFLSAFNAGEP